jgi:hypothetical protein
MASTINGTSTGSGGLVSTGDDSGILNIQTNETTAITVDASQNVGIGVTPSGWDTSAKAVQTGFGSLYQYNAVEVGITGNSYRSSGGFNYQTTAAAGLYRFAGGQWQWFNAASGTAGNAITFTQVMTLDASGNLGVGTTNPLYKLHVNRGSAGVALYLNGGSGYGEETGLLFASERAKISAFIEGSGGTPGTNMRFYTMPTNGSITEAARIDSSGNLLVGKTSVSNAATGSMFVDPSTSTNYLSVANTTTDNSNARLLYLNRQGSDGDLIQFNQANTQEGSISVSGTTVSYNGGHLSRWAQTTAPKDESIVKGTLLSNLDAMNVYTDAEGNPVDNEQLNKVKVSDTEGDVNVAGVFVNWSHDEQHNVDEINMAMTGDMIIRIAQGTTVQRGDLLMSAGDGTAKPQEDDIVRAKTVAKVTSNHVTCTYTDGTYCVPCVLMAC